jgi:hypothetical protein
LLQGQLHDVLSRLLAEAASTDAVQNLLVNAVHRLHDAVVSTLRGERGKLGVQGDSLVLDMSATVQHVFDSLGINEPAGQNDDLGTVVLIHDASALGTASSLVRALDTAVPILFVLSLVGFAAYVLLSPDKARGLRRVGYAIVIAAVASLLLWRLSNWGGSTYLGDAPIARMMIKSLVSNLRTQSLLLLAIGAVLIAVADQRVRGWIVAAADNGKAAVESLGATRAILLGAAGITLLLLIA